MWKHEFTNVDLKHLHFQTCLESFAKVVNWEKPPSVKTPRNVIFKELSISVPSHAQLVYNKTTTTHDYSFPDQVKPNNKIRAKW